ncbi:glycosyltransferase [Urechidicola sp. KH5]
MTILEMVLLVVCSIQFLYYGVIFTPFVFKKKSQAKTPTKLPPVSVIICAQNEARNITEFLPKIIEQNYGTFEIVLVNDRSFDTTLEIMKDFQLKYQKIIKIINIEETKDSWSGKKYALTLGIKAATYEHLLFIDADCYPLSKDWIQESMYHLKEKSLVLGYGAYKTIKNSLLNKMIRFETVLTAIQYFSFANIGLPYMGVGRNIGYTKSLFFENNGFSDHIHLKSGDDDLFVNQVATKENFAINTGFNSFTVSQPNTSFKSWIRQKRRHVSTATHYKIKHQYLLGLFYVSQISFWLATILALIFNQTTPIIFSLIGIRFLLSYIVFGRSFKMFHEKGLLLFAPFLELFLILVQLFIFNKNLIKKPTHW